MEKEKCKIQAIGDSVLIERKLENETEGLFKKEKSEESSNDLLEGTVVSIGEDVSKISIGDKVLYFRYITNLISFKGNTLDLINKSTDIKIRL